LCPGTGTTISASGGNNYTWQPGNLTGSSQFVSPSATTTYTVTATDINGCSATGSIMLAVQPQPNVNILASNTSVCPGSSTTLNANGGTAYTWQPGNLTGSSVNITPGSTTLYMVTGTDVNGCTATDT